MCVCVCVCEGVFVQFKLHLSHRSDKDKLSLDLHADMHKFHLKIPTQMRTEPNLTAGSLQDDLCCDARHYREGIYIS